MNNAEFGTYTLLSYEVNKDGQGKEDVINQLKPYVDAESKLVKHFFSIFNQPNFVPEFSLCRFLLFKAGASK